VFGVLPLNHIMGLNGRRAADAPGGCQRRPRAALDPVTAFDTIRDRGVTVVPGAPPMWVTWSQLTAEALAPLRGCASHDRRAKLPEHGRRPGRSAAASFCEG
jgi:acyl-CoA synthetase (AMP-forming)/AMP-acid ligase II